MEILTNAQKQAFREKIISKYDVNVSDSQIIKLTPSVLKCTIQLLCENDVRYTLSGSVLSFTEYPLQVEFNTTKATKSCFIYYIVEHQHVDIDCFISKNSKAVGVNYFSITANQLTSSQLGDDLFGDASEVYVSREQIAQLAANIHKSFRVYEEYEFEEKAFSSTFIEDFINQTKSFFELVPFEDALSSLSKYSIKDLEPNEIRSHYENMLQVRTTGVNQHIVANHSFSNSDSERTNENGSGSRGGSFLFFKASKSANYAKQKERDWTTSGKSLYDQLNELNSNTKDEAEWKFEGLKIIPKSLNLAKLVRANFQNDLKFERIKRKVINSLLSKNFKLKYRDGK